MSIAGWHNAVERRLAGQHGVGLLILRIVMGGHLMFMTQDNVFSWARMLEFRDFLAQFGFPFPLFCAVLSVIGQFGGGLALVLGLCTRFAGAIVAFNFVVAIVMVDSKQAYPGAFAALALVAAGLCLVFAGAGRYSLDRSWRKLAR
ncbi:DoxX family protein [Luteimonas sp. SX5]|uniref:DoxX family protein n=1 Tax=Luteimonas galliterrae TaxID=2940486 RepID=A0ABT0MIE9_9GAMM|nr:DoxX family protein [Luteimonas galliterrae]MCL1634463.1 DoxX family protein [Luteimonas galliterrae]